MASPSGLSGWRDTSFMRARTRCWMMWLALVLPRLLQNHLPLDSHLTTHAGL